MDQEPKLDNSMHGNRHGRPKLIILVVIILATAIPLNNSRVSDTLFEREKNTGQYSQYFKDSFDSYDQYSEILDQAPEDLSRWQDKGVITVWTDIADWQTIQRIDLKLTDADGNFVVLNGLENIQAPREDDQIRSDDKFSDYDFNCQQGHTKWEDFMLVYGRNLLFYEYNQSPKIDMSRIVKWQAYDDKGKELKIYDVVIHDGLCEKVNSLNGVWYTPNGLPQYGVWWPKDDKLIIRNVKQDQYPSNGDHGRILSSYKTPQNFISRTRFTVDSIRNDQNGYIRLAWDFDDQYNPGQDQTLIYASLKYGFLGLQRVYPIKRYFTQGFEPTKNSQQVKTKFTFESGKTYEIQAKVAGQKTWVEVYEIEGSHTKKVAEVEYLFKKARPTQAYPFSFETTGNIQVSLDEFEVWQMAK